MGAAGVAAAPGGLCANPKKAMLCMTIAGHSADKLRTGP